MSYMHSSRGYHKRHRAHHKVFLAEQLLELLLQFCFLLRRFLQRVQGLLLKFSLQGSSDLLPWVHHPLRGGKANKQTKKDYPSDSTHFNSGLLVYYILLHHIRAISASWPHQQGNVNCLWSFALTPGMAHSPQSLLLMATNCKMFLPVTG